MTKFALDSEGATVVDRGVFWMEIDKDTPRSLKLQLINKDYGVAYYGTPDKHATHWAPLPVFKRKKDD